LNNGILLRDAGLAGVYLKQWKLLKDDRRTGRGGAAMHFGEALMDSNDQPKSGSGDQMGEWTVWFTRTSDAQDMTAVTDLINNAQEAVLFLMFEPGSSGLLQVIQARLSPASGTMNENLYVHGVVNTLKPAKRGEDVSVELIGRGGHKAFDLRVIQPEGVGDQLAGWATEVMRKDFLMGQGGVIGHAIIHSKVIVIDPFTNPVVITGSHNFSQSASSKNDENLLIVKGNKGLAERYAVNIMGVYQHYRWRAYLQECAAGNIKPWDGLKKSDEWQRRDAPHDSELKFWLRIRD
jgi:phosphatidylserine/phosphatidylglycerophosphate/cardiolipin synthase-like enzyme